MQVSPDGITARDEKVFRFARERNAPLVMLTSGPMIFLRILKLASILESCICFYLSSHVPYPSSGEKMAHNKELSFELDIYSLVLINLADQILAS